MRKNSNNEVGGRLRVAVLAAIGMGSALMMGGCSSHGNAQPLQSDAFLEKPRQPLVEDSSSTVIRPNPPPAGVSIPTTPNKPSEIVHPPEPVTPRPVPGTGPGSAMPAPTSVASAQATSTTLSPGIEPLPKIGESSGKYLILGVVVAEVNGTPIYANKVLSVLERAMREKARTLSLAQFQQFAAQLIDERVHELVRDELEYATAQRLTEEQDHRMAEAMTHEWRDEQIRAAGGSLQVAKRRALDEGYDFEELAREEYRSNIVRLYYQKKIFPKIQVSATDMREYYDRNKEAIFTVHDAARFRLIKIDVARSGGRIPALDKAKEKLERLNRGEDFVAMASKENDDKFLADNAGFPVSGFISRGSYRDESVEKEIWKLMPGQISGIIEAGNAFYIAKMEERQDGNVKPFEDEQVQEKIRATLRTQQFTALRDGMESTREKNAVITFSEEMIRTTVDMALQKYAQWATASMK